MTRIVSAGVVEIEHRQAGFTLVEVLLATALSAVIALLAYNSFAAASLAAEASGQAAQRIARVDYFWQLLERDLQHLVPAPTTADGATRRGEQLGLQASPETGLLLQLVRNGWLNPLQHVRSDLQLVQYELREQRLYRRNEAFFDGMTLQVIEPETDYPRRQHLLDGVAGLQLQFLPASARALEDAAWQSHWPRAGEHEAAPVAVRVQLQLVEGERLQRLFTLPAGWSKI